jgi:hypothetical protein
LRDSKKMALNRANAPISKEQIGESCEIEAPSFKSSCLF